MKTETYRRLRRLLADNLKSALEERSVNSMSHVHKIPQKTLHNLTNIAIDPRLSTICGVASKLGFEVWELLSPVPDVAKRKTGMEWLRIYETASPPAKRMIEKAIEYALEEEAASKSNGDMHGNSTEGSAKRTRGT